MQPLLFIYVSLPRPGPAKKIFLVLISMQVSQRHGILNSKLYRDFPYRLIIPLENEQIAKERLQDSFLVTLRLRIVL